MRGKKKREPSGPASVTQMVGAVGFRVLLRNPRRLRRASARLARSLRTLRVRLTLAPSRVRTHVGQEKARAQRARVRHSDGRGGGVRTHKPSGKGF